jgi:putative acetyltransferase
MVIREFAPDDCETLATIYRRSIREVAVKDYTPAQIIAWAPDVLDMEKFAAKLVSRPTFVAEIGDIVAGFTDLEPDGHIDLFFMNPDFRRRGVARALLEHVIARAQEQKLPRLYAEVSRTARTFFEMYGFVVLEAQEVEVRGQTLENFRMERLL